MKYLFPITYFNAFEKRLPDETDFERMIASKSYKECLTVLQDTHYAEFASQEFSLEEIVNKEKKSFRKDLFKIGLSKEVLEFLYLKFDLFNLGLELKREIFGVDYSKKDLVEGSGLKIEKLKEKYCSFVEKMKNNPPKDLTKMDEKIMSFYFEKSIRISKEQGDERLEDFFESYKKFGAHIVEENGERGTRFTVFAPHARKIEVVGSFNHWHGEHYSRGERGYTRGRNGHLRRACRRLRQFLQRGRRLASKPVLSCSGSCWNPAR